MTQLTENVFAVEVPEMADTPEISIQDDGFPCLTYWYKENIDPTVIDLPPGNWRVLCTTRTCTPNQAREITGEELYPSIALAGMCKAKGLDVSKNYCLLKKM